MNSAKDPIENIYRQPRRVSLLMRSSPSKSKKKGKNNKL